MPRIQVAAEEGMSKERLRCRLTAIGSCEWDSLQGGEFLLPCCGFCAATKCRSFDNPP